MKKYLIAVVLLCLILGMVGCTNKNGEAETETAVPDGAIVLEQNIPYPHGEYRIVAANITENGALIDVSPPGEVAENRTLEVGETATVGGLSIQLVSTEADTSSEPTTAPDGHAVLVIDE